MLSARNIEATQNAAPGPLIADACMMTSDALIGNLLVSNFKSQTQRRNQFEWTRVSRTVDTRQKRLESEYRLTGCHCLQ